MKKVPQVECRRQFWWWLLPAIIAAGILSRVMETRFRIFDRYLGDALYAAMIYVILRLTAHIKRVALWTALAMTAIELFQLTGIGAEMLRSGSVIRRLCARLLGTEFSILDLLAYAVGLACIAAVDRLVSARH